jgi:hypothetical protein
MKEKLTVLEKQSKISEMQGGQTENLSDFKDHSPYFLTNLCFSDPGENTK